VTPNAKLKDMEEQILNIINHKFYDYRKGVGKTGSTGQFKMQTAKEINSHIMKFIEWFTGKDSPVSILYGNQAERFATTEKDYTIEELYQHWISEVK
jgi:hypothetical protein